ncbi:DUF4266 domain-containing protein [Polyangium aurulentum]|uniref:DUF4266 domain-containing protein n=1 Tax=Polyangium aurulentum TaxID=2567896 RepID=UPI0010AECDE1|nr:DUF4266 domain-containing protein [Polyangium aurulentum]UQA62728.1 DUF4266 domain-containing protein [Polyangium aurulentum]
MTDRRSAPARAVRLVLVLCVMTAALVTGAGCAPVAPYERGKLAHPTMAASDMSGFGESHLRAITEGATGGNGGTGSGCGCN